MFKKNKKVVHTYFGVGEVRSIETKTILGIPSRVAVCTFPLEEPLELQINIDRDYSLVRPPIPEEEVPLVLSHLESFQPAQRRPRWVIRKNLYQAKLKSGDIYQRCEVIKDLCTIARSKKLTQWEQNLLDNSRNVLISELVYVARDAQQGVEQRVDKILDYPKSA
jgi:RNA polymerase-interacting CarD/CdnL/TRCF family regulator